MNRLQKLFQILSSFARHTHRPPQPPRRSDEFCACGIPLNAHVTAGNRWISCERMRRREPRGTVTAGQFGCVLCGGSFPTGFALRNHECPGIHHAA